MRPDREKLFQLLHGRHFVDGAALRLLRRDLEAVIRMADGPRWPEGTDCGLAGDIPRKLTERTQPLPMEIEPACVYARACYGAANRAGIEAVVERFHERICDVIGYERMVELGSALGDTLLDPLFHRLGARGIDTYLNLQYLAFYRVAAAAAGLTAEAELLGLYLRRFAGDMEPCQDVEEAHIIEETPDLRQAG